jgi:hypothetical protein
VCDGKEQNEMTDKPPDDPAHRALWAMGFDEKQRDKIIAYCADWAMAGIVVSPLDVGGAIMRTASVDFVFPGEAAE